MFRENFVKNKLVSGKSVIGTWSIIPSAVVTDIICSTGLDFIIIDSEHGPINFETAQEMAIACESRNVSPIMRVSGVNESEILKSLDIGMHGIQIPNVRNSKDIEKIINYSKYPPQGNRGFSPFTRAGTYSLENSTNLTSAANENTLIGVNIEGMDAIENIDKILSFEELDIVFLGLFDISKALGIPGQVKDAKVLKYLHTLVGKILAAGKFPGTIATSTDDLKKFKEMGLKYILYLVDCEMISSSYLRVVKEFSKLN
tara:strand:- start:1107 stop:1880 length:774 start_codon:yes stop_codon:yes gene_type:complete